MNKGGRNSATVRCSTVRNEEGYHLMVTTDQNLRDQQNLERRELAIVVLLAASWPRLQQHADTVCAAIEQAESGTYTEVEVG